jgi:hypothetical protein
MSRPASRYSGTFSDSLTFSLQALLVRHETYMVDAERSRSDMTLKIAKLETDKKQLEIDNAKTVEENRGLLDQLEDLNKTIANSETHVLSLEATLQSTHQELRRLEALAVRTQDLEIQLAALEQEQVYLQKTVSTTEADERSAIQRWRKAERGLCDLQEQLERIEREAREERERHVEVVGRMERQRAVEKELNTAAGRLKGTAASTTVGQMKNGSSVVSHFVKDILQDNANLQLGIVELREMLMNSNDEVETLREQLMLHQPAGQENEDGSAPSTLRAELAPKETQVVSQELHIHHHYHAPPKKEEIRRMKKKRNVINPALFTPPSNGHGQRMRLSPSSSSAASAILSQTSITVPTPTRPSNRWSVHSGHTESDFAASSAPSSPQSMYRNSTFFDRGFIDQGLDSSRPTSPGSSIDPLSPTMAPYNRKRDSTRSFAAQTAFPLDNIIHEEEDDHGDEDIEALPEFHLTPPKLPNSLPRNLDQELEAEDYERDRDTDDFYSPVAFQPSLRRSTSHESILSISGLDIHTLKSRPSQLTMTGSPSLLRPRSRLASGGTATSYISTQPITSSSLAFGRPTLSTQGHDSTSYLRSSMGLSERAVSHSSNMASEGLGSRVGGWVWSRWGPQPTPTSPSHKQAFKATQHAADTPVVDPLQAFMGRPPGINQKGPVPGIWKAERAPSQVIAKTVDEEALREILLE